MIVTDEIKRLHAEVSADPIADSLLRGKCNWEHMTRTAVLSCWGDPRTWPVYKEMTKEAKQKEACK